ncbi:MAG: hypothetical protein IKZ08_02380 [Bacteroidales bacterium]|nr:hypothetical protein [Bacteroidales bacterium]
MEYELYHYGIKNMKWGIRRYQNPDGSLTPAGRARYNSESARLKAEEKVIKNRERVKAKMDKLKAKEKELADRKKALDDAEVEEKPKPKPKAEPKPKPVEKKTLKEMSDDEIRAVIDRIKLEREYNSYMNPEKTKKGKGFVDTVIGDIAVPAATSVGKKVVEGLLTNLANELLDLDIGKNQNQNQNKDKNKNSGGGK